MRRSDFPPARKCVVAGRAFGRRSVSGSAFPGLGCGGLGRPGINSRANTTNETTETGTDQAPAINPRPGKAEPAPCRPGRAREHTKHKNRPRTTRAWTGRHGAAAQTPGRQQPPKESGGEQRSDACPDFAPRSPPDSVRSMIFEHCPQSATDSGSGRIGGRAETTTPSTPAAAALATPAKDVQPVSPERPREAGGPRLGGPADHGNDSR